MTNTVARDFERTYGRPPDAIAFAPGRIEFIGNHTDYNGGPVLGVAIDRGVWVALAARADGHRRLASGYQGDDLRVIELPAGPAERQVGAAAWTNYPLGVIAALPAFGLRAPEGFDYLAHSNLPVGSGLSSSAAIELASALTFLAVTRQQCPLEILVQIGRHAENHFVDVPCGILDQGVSGFGRADHLVFIDCARLRFERVPLPAGVHFWIFNTHTQHALVDGLYAARHRECLAAAAALGVPQLADASAELLEDAPGRMTPALERRAQHVIAEIGRVRETVATLAAGNLRRVGELLTASHRSSQQLFENSTPELDFLVDSLVTKPHVLGARLTGGGFGGAVMAMTGAGFDAAAAGMVAGAYHERFSRTLETLHLRTGDGARQLTN